MNAGTLLIINALLMSSFILFVTLISLLAIRKTRKEQRDTIKSLKRQVFQEE
jgi:hypothetical protein